MKSCCIILLFLLGVACQPSVPKQKLSTEKEILYCASPIELEKIKGDINAMKLDKINNFLCKTKVSPNMETFYKFELLNCILNKTFQTESVNTTYFCFFLYTNYYYDLVLSNEGHELFLEHYSRQIDSSLIIKRMTISQLENYVHYVSFVSIYENDEPNILSNEYIKQSFLQNKYFLIDTLLYQEVLTFDKSKTSEYQHRANEFVSERLFSTLLSIYYQAPTSLNDNKARIFALIVLSHCNAKTLTLNQLISLIQAVNFVGVRHITKDWYEVLSQYETLI